MYMMKFYYIKHTKITKKLQKNYFYITIAKNGKKRLTLTGNR